MTDRGKRRLSARLERTVHDATSQFVELLKMAQSRYNFVALDENKADLARFVSDKLLAGAPVDTIVIVGGGFQEEDAIKCSHPNFAIRALKGFHEEADTPPPG